MRLLDRFRPRSFRAQIVVSTVLLMAVLVMAVSLLVAAVLELTARREIDSALSTHTAEVIADVHDADGRLTVPPDVLDPGELVFAPDGTLVAGTVERRAADDAATLARDGVPATTDADDLRLRATPFTTSGGVPGVVVVSEARTPYERSEQYAIIGSVALGAVAVVMAGVIARRVTTQALTPVRLMAETAEEWSETDLARRFDLGGPPNELTALAEVLDHLLERVARAIRSEQRLTDELAHELRTPLAAVQGSAELALLRGTADPEVRADLEAVDEGARRMAETITTLLELARRRTTDGDTCRVAPALDEAARLVPVPLTSRIVGPDPDAPVAVPSAVLARALAPLVDNAVAFARSEVVLTAVVAGGRMLIDVADDGPGFAPDVVAGAFDPGVSGSSGTGLGLAIARRVARTMGGDVTILDRADPTGGGCVRLDLPLA